MEKRESSYTVSGNLNCYNFYREQYGGSLRKLNVELPYDPAVPLPGIYPEKTTIWKDTCTPMFIATIFTVAKTWTQPKYPLSEKWIKKMWYVYTMKY